MAWNYKKSKPVKIEESKVITDPRSETSIRGKSKLAVGTNNLFLAQALLENKKT